MRFEAREIKKKRKANGTKGEMHAFNFTIDKNVHMYLFKKK